MQGFYSAWRLTVSRNVPFVIATFTAGDALRDQFARRRERLTREDVTATPTPTENLVVGITAALFASVLTQPVNVMKTRMMTQAASKAAPYALALECASSVLWTKLRPKKCVHVWALGNHFWSGTSTDALFRGQKGPVNYFTEFEARN